ncbi:MAG: polysaccharide deacetylase family protein [Clostridia bacterium]|nr:polysaccharide deacetylase family protein [Clostridia bacterium]
MYKRSIFSGEIRGIICCAICFFLLIFGLNATLYVSAASSGIELPILMYHSVGYNDRVHSAYLLSPEAFEADLVWLKNHGYHTVFLSEVIDYVDGKGGLPEKPVVITLDDGFLNSFTYVLPLLQKYDMKATVSVVGSFCEAYTQHPDPNPAYAYLAWSDVRALVDSGLVEIGNHTYDMHSVGVRRGCMRKADESVASYASALSSDLSRLQSMLREQVGITPTVFAYPYGAVSSEAVYVLQSLGFRAALTCSEQINLISPAVPEGLYHLGRFNRPSGETTVGFMQKVFGEK